MRCPFCGEENIAGVDLCASCGSELAGLDLPEAGSGFRGKLLTSRIGDLTIQAPVEVAPETTVAEAVVRMRAGKAGCVLVVRDGDLVGLFNERHLISRVLARGLEPETTAVSSVMSADPLRLDPDDPPAFAIHRMVSYGFRHLAVVSKGRVAGFISVRDILGYLRDHVLAA